MYLCSRKGGLEEENMGKCESLQCTIYIKTIRSKKIRTSILDLDQIIKEIQGSSKRRLTVEALRREVRDLPPLFHWRDIDRLPRICPGEVVKRKRDGSSQARYTGVTILDVNNITSQQEAAAIKAKAAAWPTTLATFIGSSGLTVKILVRGTLDDNSLPTRDDAINAFHAKLYEETARVYSTLLQRTLKPRKAKPQDCFRWTYDPTAYYNDKAMPVMLSLSEVMSGSQMSDDSAHEYGPTSNAPSQANESNARRRFATAFAKAIEQSSRDYTPEEELNAVAEAAYAEALPLEQTIRQAIVTTYWYDLGREKIRETVESVYTELDSKGKKSRGKGSAGSTMQMLNARLQEFMTAHYDLRYNELTNGVEWRPNNSASYTFRALDVRTMNTMIQACHNNGIEVYDRDMKRYLGSTLVRNYNAARAYLREVEGCWDGKTDYIGMLADRVPCRNPKWREWFHTWFLGMVAQWDGWNTIYGNAAVPLLIGPQGCGKSTFGQLILPPELREAGYRELVDFSSKLDVERMLSTSLLINLDEFNQISERIQQGFLKNLIQKSNVKGRRPYSNTIQNLPRFASFIATTNLSDVLNDPSGSRRFIVADIRSGAAINTGPRFYYPELYAQALSELEHGRNYYFTPAEVNEIENYNANYMTLRPEVSQLLDSFELLTDAIEGSAKMKVTDIARRITRRSGYKYSQSGLQYLGRWLTGQARNHHVAKTNINGTAAYLVKEISTEC